jgi:hypothetical protein
MLPRLDQQPRRGPFTRDEQRAIERAIRQGKLTRIANGSWRPVLGTSFAAIVAQAFAQQRGRANGAYG